MNVTVSEEDIPKSFTASVDRPFDPIGKRDIYNAQFDRNNQRLSDEQVRQLWDNPPTESKEPTRIQKLSDEANKKRTQNFEKMKFYNMSLKQLGFRTSDTVHEIIDDVLTFDPRDGPRGFIDIFVKEDRLVYIGLIILVLGILIALVHTTDGGGSAPGPISFSSSYQQM